MFVVYGYQGAEEDAEKLRLTDRLLQAVLAEAQVVCASQPVLIAGDLNADPAVIPCLAKGMSAGRYVDLALAHSLGAGVMPGIRSRRLGGQAVGGRSSSRLYRVSQGDEVDRNCAQFFVNSSLSPFFTLS